MNWIDKVKEFHTKFKSASGKDAVELDANRGSFKEEICLDFAISGIKPIEDYLLYKVVERSADLSKFERVFRAQLIVEEAREVLDALMKADKDQLAKELCDLIYVSIGTAILFGIDLDSTFERIHASNMTKVRLPGDVRMKRKSEMKGFKPC